VPSGALAVDTLGVGGLGGGVLVVDVLIVDVLVVVAVPDGSAAWAEEGDSDEAVRQTAMLSGRSLTKPEWDIARCGDSSEFRDSR
jgi:hypothetical protein